MATSLWMISLIVLPCMLIVVLPMLAFTAIRLDLRGTARLVALITVFVVAIAIAAVIVAAAPAEFGSL